MGRKKSTREEQINRLEAKYGVYFLDDMETLKVNPDCTLQKVAVAYGITRERVRQIFIIVYGEPYTNYRGKK